MSAPRIYEFGPFRVDASRRLLTRAGAPIALAPKPFALLLHFLRHAGQTLSKEQLIETLWKDGVGTEANLSVNVAAVRRALGEHPRDHHYVVTMPMRGYCFVADVRRVEGHGGSPDAPPERVCRLAVVPFDVVPGREGEDHLGAGFADAVSSSVPPLRDWSIQSPQTVRRIASDGSDPLEYGRRLEADAVLSGTIEHRPDGLVVSVQMNMVGDASVHWGDTYIETAKGLPRLPERIASDLARAVENDGRGTHDGSKHHCSESLEASQEYLKGRFLMEQAGAVPLRESLVHLRRALELDPQFAAAQAALAGAYYNIWRLGQASPAALVRNMEEAARRALELDPTLPEPYFWLANLNMSYHWNWPVAGALFRRGLAYAPNSSLGHTLYAYYLLLTDRPEKAVSEARLGQVLEPTNLFANAALAIVLRETGDAESALGHIETVLHMAPGFLWGRVVHGVTLLTTGRYGQAAEHFTACLERAKDMPWALAGMAFSQVRLGHETEAREVMKRLEALAPREHVDPLILALAHLGFEEHDEALACLERAYEKRSPILVFQLREPLWGDLRNHSRFRAIFDRIGSPSD